MNANLIRVFCPNCNADYEVSSEDLGQAATCAECQHVFTLAAPIQNGPKTKIRIKGNSGTAASTGTAGAAGSKITVKPNPPKTTAVKGSSSNPKSNTVPGDALVNLLSKQTLTTVVSNSPQQPLPMKITDIDIPFSRAMAIVFRFAVAAFAVYILFAAIAATTILLVSSIANLFTS